MRQSELSARPIAQTAALSTLVVDDLKRRLAAGEWSIGDKMPTEAQLSAQYGVSRATARTAIKILESQGVVRTQHGKGSFITPFGVRVSTGLQELRSTSETLRSQGMEPVVSCRLSERRTASPECAAALSLPEDAPVLYLERVVNVGGESVVFSYDEVVGDLIPDPTPKERFSGSLFQVFEEETGARPAYASTTINAEYDDSIGWGPRRPPKPLYLVFRQAHFSRDGRPVLYSRNCFVEGIFDFTVTRTS